MKYLSLIPARRTQYIVITFEFSRTSPQAGYKNKNEGKKEKNSYSDKASLSVSCVGCLSDFSGHRMWLAKIRLKTLLAETGMKAIQVKIVDQMIFKCHIEQTNPLKENKKNVNTFALILTFLCSIKNVCRHQPFFPFRRKGKMSNKN